MLVLTKNIHLHQATQSHHNSYNKLQQQQTTDAGLDKKHIVNAQQVLGV